MEKEIQKNKHILTELEVRQLKEQRNKIITNAAFMSAGIVDLAILKMFSNTVGTDDMNIADLVFLFLGGSSSFLGLTLMGVNAIDYMDMKKDIYGPMKTKSRIKKCNGL